MAKLQNRKNIGIDYISNKMLKHAGPKLMKEIFNLFANIHDTAKIPRELFGGGGSQYYAQRYQNI
jgi:hypothetical protein